MKPGCRVDQLDDHAYLVTVHLDAALEVHADAQPLSHHAGRCIRIQSGRVAARGYEKSGDPRQPRNHIVDKAVGESLGFVAPVIVEKWQHGDRVLGDDRFGNLDCGWFLCSVGQTYITVVDKNDHRRCAKGADH